MRFQENSKSEHIFAILRFDSDMAAEFGMKTDYITVTRIVRSEDQAIAEVQRLNQLNGDKGAVYFWRSSRLTPDLQIEAVTPSNETRSTETVASSSVDS
jgi:hypothetical protein